MGRAALVATAAWAASPPRGWPAFLPSPDGFPADVVAAVERTWTDRTLSRTVRGPSVRAPFDRYSALIDAPDVTAAAARYRNFSGAHEARGPGIGGKSFATPTLRQRNVRPGPLG